MPATKFPYGRFILPLIAAALCSCGGGSAGSGGGPGFSISVSPATVAVVPGASGSGTVTVSPGNGFTGMVNVTVSNVPVGVTVAPNPLQFSISSSPVSQPITVSAGIDTPLQNFVLAFAGVSESVTASAKLNLQVQPLSVTTSNYDNTRSGVNSNETILNLANVNPTTFGLLFNLPADGTVIGQALYLPNVSIAGKGTHNVVYAATMHDSVYAFDADSNTGANANPLWQVSLLPPGATPVPVNIQGCSGVTDWTEVGVVAMPVIDPATGTIYVVAKTYENENNVFRLHALDVTSGAEKFGGPVLIQATYTLNGETDTFNPLAEINRPALLLTNGHVYVAFGSNGCNAYGDKGWVLSYNSSSLAQEGVFTTEPGNALAAVWMKGGGLSSDSASNIYGETGEGDFTPGTNFGISVFRLVQSGSNLQVADWFTPWNQAFLSQNDLDLNDAVLLLPDQPGSHPHLALAVGKDGTVYVLDRDNMGKYCADCTRDTQIVEELPQVAKETGCLVYWNGIVYTTGTGYPVMGWALNNGSLSTTPVVQTQSADAGGHSPVLTSAGTANGILWQINGSNLTAYNATTLARLYVTSQTNGRDTLPPLPHYSQLMVVNGKVYVGTTSGITVLGLL
jgi:hypothetical protein